MIRSLLVTLRQIINVYLFLCFIKIILSWIPAAAYSSFGRMLSAICDPYLDWFRRFRFTRIGMIDFSPVLSLGILSISAQLITSILATGTVSLWGFFVSIIQLAWSFIGFILNLLIIFLIIRLLYDLLGSSASSPFWYNLDKFLNPVITKTTQLFPGRFMSYRSRLILTIVLILMLRLMLGLFVGSLLFQFKVISII